MSGVSLEIQDKLSPAIRHLVDALDGPGRVEGSQAMGEAVQDLVVAHLARLAGTRHFTANRLGGSPTGFLEGAARAASAGVVQADSDGVSIAIRHPAVARAFRDILIKPKKGQNLAIPINGIAYGTSPAELKLQGHQLFRNRNVLMEATPNGVVALFLLVKSATQKQDRSLMPSADEINSEAAKALTIHIIRKKQEVGL